jgi:hypothetical protein
MYYSALCADGAAVSNCIVTKKRTHPMLGFKLFETAMKTIEGIETINMIKKRQVKLKNLSALNNVQLFNQLFGMIA